MIHFLDAGALGLAFVALMIGIRKYWPTARRIREESARLVMYSRKEQIERNAARRARRREEEGWS